MTQINLTLVTLIILLTITIIFSISTVDSVRLLFILAFVVIVTMFIFLLIGYTFLTFIFGIIYFGSIIVLYSIIIFFYNINYNKFKINFINNKLNLLLSFGIIPLLIFINSFINTSYCVNNPNPQYNLDYMQNNIFNRSFTHLDIIIEYVYNLPSILIIVGLLLLFTIQTVIWILKKKF